MNSLQKQELQTEITVAIQKILDKAPALGTLFTESTASHMATAAVHVLVVTKDASNTWEYEGYLEI